MNKKGFTLIELLATITIMALILLMVIPAISALQKNNKTKPYEYYADSLVEAAKIYVLRENEDLKNMGTENWEGCIEISYQDLLNSDLIKPYQDEEVDCSNAVIRYNRIERENVSKYTYNMTCINTTDNSVLYEYQGIDGSSCSFKTLDTVVDVLMKDNTAGLNSMEDDDGLSYYFNGNVDNLVQFGMYEKDYYVYSYTINNKTYNYQSLESCQLQPSNSTCNESNKVLMYVAGTPMYWRIVRINGDGTLRLLYSGTSADATEYNLMIGNSMYNANSNDPKYTGYTYDGTDSLIKKEVDTWYTNALSTSSYDQYIVMGRFCNDTSGYGSSEFDTSTSSISFAGFDRLYHYQTISPILKCPVTYESYGGSYRLKAGLITADEMVLGGDKVFSGSSDNYLSYGKNDSYYWTMSPFRFGGNTAMMFIRQSFLTDGYVNDRWYHVRPVINVDVSNLTITGSGTVIDPYVLK